MSAKKSALAAAVICVAAVAGLTGCDKGDGGKKDSDTSGSHASGGSNGVGDKSAEKIGRSALSAVKSAPSLRLKGHIVSDGRNMALDMSTTHGGDCTGTVGLGKGHADVRSKGKTAYVKADKAFWNQVGHGKQSSGFGGMLAGRWLKVPQNALQSQAGAGGDPMAACDVTPFLGAMDADHVKDFTKGSPTTVDGVKTVPLTRKKGGQTETMYVSTEGKPYPRKLVKKGGKDSGEVTVGDFGKHVSVTTPPKGQTIDLGKMLGGKGGGKQSLGGSGALSS